MLISQLWSQMAAWLFTILRVANWWDPRSKVCDLWLGDPVAWWLWDPGSVVCDLWPWPLVCGVDGLRPWPWCLGDNGEPNGGVELWWPNCPVAWWSSDPVTPWLGDPVNQWLVALWLHGFVALWICGFLILWSCDSRLWVRTPAVYIWHILRSMAPRAPVSI